MYLFNTRKVPIILGLTQHPIYREHWTVAYGTYQIMIVGYSTEIYYYYTVNDGWGRDGVQIAQSYTDWFIHLS